ncbi:exocyst complex component Sec3-domain-containing protein [Suillus discolor]|uniref:Exocyst complex component Sec3-domain-containing protein n=1 Tax=Suillus discolor TaxID=1912936 RepID=A0A9P7FL25_9AGAM|nr:exocyst complex component Sec3-domain-containing protein [Suillus discolor]KAG2120700.1 exocyst complex component Sec3-domain-containing protein [Suillus discolor]
MSDHDHTKQRIIASVFDKRNTGAAIKETYVGHIKIWEDAGEDSGKKPRYILLSQGSDGTGFLHKSKLNTNGSFSVGKTWKLSELRGIEVSNPASFNITLARTYKWQTENHLDQANFISAAVKLFYIVTNGTGTLHLVGVRQNEPGPANGASESSETQVTQAPQTDLNVTPGPARRQAATSRAGTPQPGMRTELPTRTQVARPPSRAPSPAGSNISNPPQNNSSLGVIRPPSPSPASQLQGQPQTAPSGLPSSLRPRVIRRLSNATPPQNTSSNGLPANLVPARAPLSASPLRTPKEIYPFAASRPSAEFVHAPSPLSAAPAVAQLPRSESPLSVRSQRSQKLPSSKSIPTPEPPQPRREHNNRVSFFDPLNQTALDRLVAGDYPDNGSVGEEETSQATMASVEEMLEGFEWAGDDLFGKKNAKGAADLVEARLLDELIALEKANVHSFVESDDRVALVMNFLDEAITEVDAMDSLISSYKIHLNAVGDDISFIQSQRRGLQVQTQNQRALLSELENLLQTVQVDREVLVTLTQESLEKASGIHKLETAATELYKALQAGQDTDMAATMERLDEYRTHNAQFCKRIYDYLSIMSVAQAEIILDGNNGITKPGRGRPVIKSHQGMETYLGRYAGLLLYLKEMDESVYSRFCGAYFSATSELHKKQMGHLLSIYAGLLKRTPDEDADQNFGSANENSQKASIRRAGTIVRSPIEGRKDRNKDRERQADEYRAPEALGLILEQIAPQIYREGDFIADFLQINDAGLTFADYAGLDNYFRRQAARSAGLSQTTMKLARGAMDLIFGFLPAELKQWIDSAIAKDTLQVVGVLVCLERFVADADERDNAFFLQMLEKQHTRLKGSFDRHINQQIKMIEETKLTSKKRKGVAHFVKYFPIYVSRIEQQLIGADGLEIRANIDLAYEKIVHSMFECLKHMATLDGDDEDKGQLNYHVLLVENMHYFVAEMSQLDVGSVSGFPKQAEAIYNENLNAYVKIVLRRPFAKIIDYFDGIERLLTTTAPTEVSKNSNYNRSSLKKVVKEFDGKDIRKHIDALFKRVEKHFTEAEEKATKEESSGIAPGTVMVGVWKTCEEELQRMTENFNKRISQCYADSGVSLEYTSADVETSFRRHRLGS